MQRLYRISELEPLGFSRHEVTCDCRVEGQTFATRTSERGAWKIDLDKYMEFRQRRSPAIREQKRRKRR